MKPVSYLFQGKNIILVVDGKSHTISKDTHMNYAKIVDALKSKDWDVLRDLVEPKKAIINFGKGYVTIESNKVLWKGQPFNNGLADRMITMYQDGFPIDPMVHLMENLMQNPSNRSVAQFYGFVEKNNLPITEDGYILAFKKVRKDYMDIHSGTISNHIGAVIEMDRNLVDDNPDSHCSSGLHFCSESYLSNFGSANDPVMIMKINPADVVSIPTDYNGAKGRCCKYEVVAEVAGDPKDAFASIVDDTYAVPKVKPVPAKVWGEPAKPTPVKPKAFAAPKAKPEVSPKVVAVKAAVAPKLVPQAVWPFPPTAGCGNNCPACDCDGDAEFDVQRKSTGEVMHSNLTLAEAEQYVAAAKRQKKATLVIVCTGTDTAV